MVVEAVHRQMPVAVILISTGVSLQIGSIPEMVSIWTAPSTFCQILIVGSRQREQVVTKVEGAILNELGIQV